MYIKEFYTWLTIVPTNISLWLIGVLGWDIAYTLIVSMRIIRWLGDDTKNRPSKLDAMTVPKMYFAIAMVSGIEEILRLVPLAIFIWIFPNEPIKILIAAFVLAIIFGALHASNGPSILQSILVQGVSGIIMNIVFLKCGGLTGKPYIGILSSYAIHVSFNYFFLSMKLLAKWSHETLKENNV